MLCAASFQPAFPPRWRDACAALHPILLGLALLAPGKNMAEGEAAARVKVQFPDSREIQTEGADLVEKTAALFRSITGQSIAELPIRVLFVAQPGYGTMSRSGTGEVQSVTSYSSNLATIEISTRCSSSWGRILVHEITHVFVRGAYGRATNKTLSEGFADYMARQLFASEVDADIRIASKPPISPELRPYVDGYRFCKKYAKDPRFAQFFAAQITLADTPFEELEKRFLSLPEIAD